MTEGHGWRLETARGWRLETARGNPSDLHAASAALVGAPAPSPAVRILEATSTAIVLGRAQPAEHVSSARAARAGVPVVRRCSGGGAVLIEPGGAVWVDVLVPMGHRRWDDDVGRAAWWLGAAWADALASVGLAGGVVHRGGLARGQWGDRVCFAGVGPGEVTIDGRKVVGISQRRTRGAALFQCCAVVSWEPAPLLDLLALDDAERAAALADLANVAVGVGPRAAAELAAALADTLAARAARD